MAAKKNDVERALLRAQQSLTGRCEFAVIEARGYQRNRDLLALFEEMLRDFEQEA